jgi:hypothetical protein
VTKEGLRLLGDRQRNPAPVVLRNMPRLLPSDKCPKCQGPLKRQPTLLGALYACGMCDKDDPMKAADAWIKGELKPPT